MYRLAWAFAVRINKEKSGKLVFVAFSKSNDGSVEFLPMHRLACAFAAGNNEKKTKKICMFYKVPVDS